MQKILDQLLEASETEFSSLKLKNNQNVQLNTSEERVNRILKEACRKTGEEHNHSFDNELFFNIKKGIIEVIDMIDMGVMFNETGRTEELQSLNDMNTEELMEFNGNESNSEKESMENGIAVNILRMVEKFRQTIFSDNGEVKPSGFLYPRRIEGGGIPDTSKLRELAA